MRSCTLPRRHLHCHRWRRKSTRCIGPETRLEFAHEVGKLIVHSDPQNDDANITIRCAGRQAQICLSCLLPSSTFKASTDSVQHAVASIRRHHGFEWQRSSQARGRPGGYDKARRGAGTRFWTARDDEVAPASRASSAALNRAESRAGAEACSKDRFTTIIDVSIRYPEHGL